MNDGSLHLVHKGSPLTLAVARDRASDRERLSVLLSALQRIHADLLALESEFEHRLADYAAHQQSARNLIHYLALRRHDVRLLQEQLTALGLSSLGRTESHVIAGIEAVLKALCQLARLKWLPPVRRVRGIGFTEGKALLRANTDALMGPRPHKRRVRIMVTMPGEAADNLQLVRQLVAGGMDCMRINCAHDGIEAWRSMVANLQRATHELGKACHVQMDLAGPKLRTGPIDPHSQVVKWRPQRDLEGRVTVPAQVWLTSQDCPEPPPFPVSGCLYLPAALLADARRHDRIKFEDLRGKAEAQEEILWVCEAAHIPVIWATQVLENLANKGVPSRAEITDAAMGERAECVMLNKGPHLVEAVRLLDGILCRMEAHQSKKSARLRRLRLSAIAAADGRCGSEFDGEGLAEPAGPLCPTPAWP